MWRRGLAVAADEDDRPGPGDAGVVGAGGGDAVGGECGRGSGRDAAGEQSGGPAGTACGTTAGDGTDAATAVKLLPAWGLDHSDRAAAGAATAAGAVLPGAVADGA